MSGLPLDRSTRRCFLPHEPDAQMAVVAERLVLRLAAAAKEVLLLDRKGAALDPIPGLSMLVGRNRLQGERGTADHTVRAVRVDDDLHRLFSGHRGRAKSGSPFIVSTRPEGRRATGGSAGRRLTSQGSDRRSAHRLGGWA